MAADSTSLKSSTSSKPRTPGVEGVVKKVGFARPTLIIPPPQAQYNPQYVTYTPGGISTHSHHSHGMPGYGYGAYSRKASMFVMNQFDGIKGFAKSGLGFGERCSYWCYGKVSLWSRKWITHCFLSIVLGLYTAGGALLFMYIEDMIYLVFKKLVHALFYKMDTLEKAVLNVEDYIFIYIRRRSRNFFYFVKVIVIFILGTVVPAYVFMLIEGKNEEDIKERDLRYDRYKLIGQLRNLSITMPEKTTDDEWEGAAARLIFDYEDYIIDAYKKSALILTNRGHKIWTLWNSIVYCATVYTTLGYGHIYPSTPTGRALTIVYAIVGIPLFLIALTDFGKLFTRGIKFLWSFVRRLYYTGSCKKVRKSATASEIFRGAQLMYGIATFRRSSANPEDGTLYNLPVGSVPVEATAPRETLSEETPTTPDLSTFEIDDEFNLPISVALFILVAYMFIGALVYCAWEEWEFFTSFYFVFISLSTIGFGDFIPEKPIVLILSIVYLVFGLALMSMCINVVQAKLSNTFQQASIKLSSSMGFEVGDSGQSIDFEESEIASVHKTSEGEDREVDGGNENNNSVPNERFKLKEVQTKSWWNLESTNTTDSTG